MAVRAFRIHSRARCNALNEKLEVCRVPYGEHGGITGHAFDRKPTRKSHIPWALLGQDHAYCGRQPHQQPHPENMVFLGRATVAQVRRAARLNLICTACFKNWLYLKEREAFIGARHTW